MRKTMEYPYLLNLAADIIGDEPEYDFCGEKAKLLCENAEFISDYEAAIRSLNDEKLESFVVKTYKELKNFDEIAAELNCTKDELKNEIYPKVLRKLRHPSRSKFWHKYLETTKYMQINNIYQFSYDYLLGKIDGKITKEQLDDCIFNADKANCNSIEDAFDLLLNVLQDFQMYPNVIQYRNREREIKEIIGFPDLKKCASWDPKELSEIFIKKYNSNSSKCWLNYCRGITSGAKFLSNFTSFQDFKRACDVFDTNDITRASFALYLSSKIKNMGFATACNWLKELGYYSYPKPDVHMKDICYAIGLIDDETRDMDCFEAVLKVAKANSVSPYTLDKVWWLICSGNLYRYNISIGNNKREFLEELQQKFHKY